MGGSQGNRASQGSWHGRDDRAETQHDEPIPGSPTRFNPRYRYRALCLVSLRWRLSEGYCWGNSPEPRLSLLRLLLMIYPRCSLASGHIFLTKGSLVDGAPRRWGPSSMVSCRPVLSPGCHSRHRRWARRNSASLGSGPVFPVLIMPPMRCTLTIDHTICPTSGQN